MLEWLDERHPGRFNASHLRTLQRRIRDWRALAGPDREVYFEQEHPPGREAQMDFTHCDSLEVTMGGEQFDHMLFEFILSHSGWRYAQVTYSETFAALVSGLQGALWDLGAVPEVVRSDNLSAATHKLKDGKGRDFNERYQAILDHYGLKATRTNTYSAHENGVAEQGHRRIKDIIAQALILRGSSDFESVDEYVKFIRSLVDRRNKLVREKLTGEYPHLRAAATGPCTRVRQLQRQGAQVEHHQSGQQNVLCALAADRDDGGREAVSRPRRGLLQGTPGGEHGPGTRQGRGAHRLPPHNRLACAQAGSVRALLFQRAAVSHAHLPAGVRRYVGLEGRASGRGLCSDTAPCRDDNGVRGGEGSEASARVEGTLRLRGGEADWRHLLLWRYRRSSCPARWTWGCMTDCLREVRDDDGCLRAKRSGRSHQTVVQGVQAAHACG